MDQEFFKNSKGVVCRYSRKKFGNMKSEEGKENREAFFQRTLRGNSRIVLADTVHKNKVKIVDSNSPDIISQTDALVTREKGLILGVTFADCPPVLLFDPVSRTVGIAHAGYKGILGRIVPKTIEKMKKLGADPDDIEVFIGPGICAGCYEFGPEARDVFRFYTQYVFPKPESNKFLVDLKGMLREQVLWGGISFRNVRISQICTFEDREFFSARRDGKPLRVGIAFIGLK